MVTWNEKNLPSQSGKTVVITGANSGVGFETAKVVVALGADVIMACRDLERSKAAAAQVASSGPGSVQLLRLDLADLDSIPAFAEQVQSRTSAVDALVNNAGIMGGFRQSSAQGFEAQMATNHLGHFALTATLLPLLLAATSPKVISLSSLAARSGLLNEAMTAGTLVDPQPYRAYPVYCNTKQATLLFAQELHRRARAAKTNLISLAVHPGVSATNLFNRQLRDYHLSALTPVVTGLGRVALQSPKGSARSEIRALTDDHLQGGEFLGPTAFVQFRGRPEVIPLYRVARNPSTATRLWALSEQITTTPFSF